MKKILIIFITYFITHISFGQNNNIQHDTVIENDYWEDGMTFIIQGGVWIPIGGLDKYFDLNPNIGLMWGVPISKKLRIEFGASINIPLNSEPFNFIVDDTSFIVNSKNTVNGMLGIWLSHENRLGKKILFDKYFGLGVGFIQTDKKNIQSKNEVYGVETINFNFGLGMRKKIFNTRSIGFFVEYNFVPYQLFGKVEESFGNSSVVTGLLYGF